MTNEDVIQGQVLTTEPPAVYGIWIIVQGSKGPLPGSWLILGDGAVFHTIYRAVAEAQLIYAIQGCGGDCSVRPFPSPTD